MKSNNGAMSSLAGSQGSGCGTHHTFTALLQLRLACASTLRITTPSFLCLTLRKYDSESFL